MFWTQQGTTNLGMYYLTRDNEMEPPKRTWRRTRAKTKIRRKHGENASENIETVKTVLVKRSLSTEISGTPSYY